MKKIIYLITILFLSNPSNFSAQTQTVGNFINTSQAFEGYNLLAPQSSFNTYLIDNCGRAINQWESDYRIGLSTYLLEDGSLIRTGQLGSDSNASFSGGGTGGRLERFNWEGDLIWEMVWADSLQHQHHDIEIMPNGNILILAWENHTYEDALAQGKNPNATGNPVWCCQVTEIEPTGNNGGEVVWQWSAWDHLVQDTDSLLPNYGVISENPRKFNINYTANGNNALAPDWMHCNAIDYNSNLNQIIISSAKFNEIFIIPHNFSTEETAEFYGDLLWRYGNPATYNRGTVADQKLFFQHDCQWIDDTSGGDGLTSQILLFNNGRGRPQGDLSSVEEIETPAMYYGTYPLEDNTSPFEPDTYSWRYPEAAELNPDFYAQQVSGASRLPNGNTLICSGPSGYGFEVTPDEEVVWDYLSPVTAFGATTQGNDAGNNSVFRLPRYASDYPAFEGRDMTPGDVIEQDSWIDNCISDIATHEIPELNVYPNPFRDIVRVICEESGVWTISSMDGKLLESGLAEMGETIEIGGDLAEGYYFFRIEYKVDFAIKTLIKI